MLPTGTHFEELGPEPNPLGQGIQTLAPSLLNVSSGHDLHDDGDDDPT